MIDSRIVANGSVKEYQDRVVEFSHKEGVDLMKSLKTFWGKKWVSKQKCTIKINFMRTNHILGDDIIPNSLGGIAWVKST